VNLPELHATGQVRRYHAHPRLSVHGQTVADHAWGVAAIISLLHPAPSAELLSAAIWHDAGERWAGDLPYPAKCAEPAMATAHAAVEARLAAANGVPQCKLSEIEARWLRFADRLESVLWCRLRDPVALVADDWRESLAVVAREAAALGVGEVAAGMVAERESSAGRA
jgi:5'-deoxynucleotidase